jgi:hypothetical protein
MPDAWHIVEMRVSLLLPMQILNCDHPYMYISNTWKIRYFKTMILALKS